MDEERKLKPFIRQGGQAPAGEDEAAARANWQRGDAATDAQRQQARRLIQRRPFLKGMAAGAGLLLALPDALRDAIEGRAVSAVEAAGPGFGMAPVHQVFSTPFTTTNPVTNPFTTPATTTSATTKPSTPATTTLATTTLATTRPTTQAPSTPATTTPATTPPATTGASRRVVLCHKGQTIIVDEHAVAAHLAHGDTLGPCP